MNMEAPVPIPLGDRLPDQVAFDRRELSLILRLYGQMVAAGEWRDYGLSFGPDVAVFAVYRRTADARCTGSKSAPSCGRSRACMP